MQWQGWGCMLVESVSTAIDTDLLRDINQAKPCHVMYARVCFVGTGRGRGHTCCSPSFSCQPL